MRHCCDATPYERFLKNSSSTVTLPNKVTQGLYDSEFTCRCESCDQAAVDKGDNKRLQALFKDINMYAKYVP